MNLDFFKNIEKGLKDTEVQEFINKLSKCLDNFKKDKSLYNQQGINNDVNDTNQILHGSNDKLNTYREEDCLYQVIGMSRNGVYLQNTNNNKVFEEVKISQELKDSIGNDYILRYKNGDYIFEEELTDKFFEGLVNINEYKKRTKKP